MELTHASCVAQALQKVALLGIGTTGSGPAPARSSASTESGAAHANASAGGRAGGAVYLSAAPLHHIAGLSASLTVCAAGGCHVIPRSTRPEHLRAALLRGAGQQGDSGRDSSAAASHGGGGKRVGASGARASGAAQQRSNEMLPVSLLVVVPAHLHALTAGTGATGAPASRADDTHLVSDAVTTIMVGGGTPTPSLVRAARCAFPRARLVLSYAATEAGSTITTLELYRPPPLLGHPPHAGPSASACDAMAAADRLAGGIAVGFAVPIAQVALLPPEEETPGPTTGSSRSRRTRPETGSQPHCRRNEVGEIVVRGAGLMRGYWRKPEATARAFRSDGWLRTGDLGGFAHDGSLVLLGRRDDVVKTGGENVHAGEVERVLCLIAQGAVQEAAVVGVRDARLGERLVAVLVRAANVAGGAVPSDEALIAACRGSLAGFKVPRTFLWWPAERLPRTASGKVVKWRLRTAVAAALGAGHDGPRARL